MNIKTICFDYDGTYTDFPELMDAMIAKSKYLGYRVILATMRYEAEEDPYIYTLREKFDRVIFTGRLAKQPFLKALGIEPDIWIDDEPKWITTDALYQE